MKVPLKTNSKVGQSIIKSPIGIIAIIVIAVTLISIVLSTIYNLNIQFKADLKRELSGVLRASRGSIYLWIDDVKAHQSIIAQFPTVRRFVVEENSEHLIPHVQEILSPWAHAHSYLGYAIYRKKADGSLKLLLQQENIERDLFSKAQDSVNLGSKGYFHFGRPLFFSDTEVISVTAMPIKNPAGKVIGVMALQLNLRDKFTAVANFGRMGSSGQSYAVNESGERVTGTHFGGNPFFIDRKPGESKQKYNFNLTGYENDQGDKVVGAWTWDDYLGLGLVTEIDKSEAFRSYAYIDRLVWITIITVVVFMTAILFLRELFIRQQIGVMKQKEEARKEFLSIVAHDLKNPLNTVFASNELLLRILPKNDKAFDRHRNLLRTGEKAATQMKNLITDFLDSSRIEAGKINLEFSECDGVSLANECLNMIELRAAEKDVIIVRKIPESLPKLWADSNRLLQVFSNLLANALKFTPQGGKITVEATPLEGYVKFTVLDTGIGISKEDQEHLFEPFWQVNKSQSAVGTGLGLSICKDIIASHHGEIWIDSHQGEGAAFNFTIPTH